MYKSVTLLGLSALAIAAPGWESSSSSVVSASLGAVPTYTATDGESTSTSTVALGAVPTYTATDGEPTSTSTASSGATITYTAGDGEPTSTTTVALGATITYTVSLDATVTYTASDGEPTATSTASSGATITFTAGDYGDATSIPAIPLGATSSHVAPTTSDVPAPSVTIAPFAGAAGRITHGAAAGIVVLAAVLL